MPMMHQAIGQITAIMAQPQPDSAVWEEIREQIALRRQLCESEMKHLIGMRQMLSLEEALALAARITDIVTRHCHDKAALSAIIVELQQLMKQGEGPTYSVAEDEPC